MSILQMVYAWKVQDISGTDKLVLLALADWANDQGLCWPSLDTLAGKSSLNVRTVSNAIKRLEQGGFIRRETEVGKGTRYWLTVKEPCAPELNTPLHEVQTTSARGADNTTKIHQKDIYKVDWPDWLPLDAWVGFVNMRNAIKKPMTARAVQNLLTKLEKMRAAGQDVAEVLDQSTNACWADVYEVKERRNGKQRKQISGTATAAQRAIDHYEARNH